jgi:hypothetical protein
MLRHRAWLGLIALSFILGSLQSARSADDKGWVTLFNGKDLTGWKIRNEKYTVTKYVNEKGDVIAGAKEAKVEQTLAVVDAKGKIIEGAKPDKVDGKDVGRDAAGKVIEGAKVAKVGGRTAIVDKDGKELKDAKKVQETFPNTTGGWKAEEGGLLICGNGHGSDIYTEQKFTDFELHVEFLGTGNSGVYLQGRYEIQVDNSYGAKPKIIEKDGKKIEVFDSHQCGAIYGRIAPSKNMAKPPKEWQSFDVVFKGARGTKDPATKKVTVTQKAFVTLIWNGEKVIDNGEIEGPTGAALDGNVIEPGPLLLQGDHGKVTFKNVKIKPLSSEK